MRRVRFYLDTEFMEDGTVIELLSIGVVCEDGREFYAENAEADWGHANDWVRDNVIPHLIGPAGQPCFTDGAQSTWLSRQQIRDRLYLFVQMGLGGGRPEFWAYFAGYDWIVVCQLFGTMVDLPKDWPKFCMDVKQSAVEMGNPHLPTLDGTAHIAIDDARDTKFKRDFLVGAGFPGRPR